MKMLYELISGLLESVKLETETKDNLERAHIDKMRHKRAEYDEKMAAEELEPFKTKKVSIKQNEPPIVNADTVIDVSNEYVELEDKQNSEAIQTLAPDHLELTENEV